MNTKESQALFDPTQYRKLIGKLNFLIYTRLDLDCSVRHLSQFIQDPSEPHLQDTFHILRYLKGDPTLGIFMSYNLDNVIRGFCDSDWAAYSNSRRFISVYIVLLGNSPIS